MPCIRIERAVNGFTVCVDDPEVVKSNQKSDNWKDPCREYVFETMSAMTKFIELVADKALPKDSTVDSFADAFKTASEDDEED
jgi:hypothetical protein